jgi:putative flippase GtrA
LLFSQLGEYGYLIGAVLGLTLGYWVKFHLDRRFTFRAAECS